MASLDDVVFDCGRPASLARFWAAALDGYEVAPYDVEEPERPRGMGVDDPEDDPNVMVQPRALPGPRLFLNRVPEPKSIKNRLHLSLRSVDVETEVVRLVALGARELGRAEDWVSLADPEGNEFDLLPRN